MSAPHGDLSAELHAVHQVHQSGELLVLVPSRLRPHTVIDLADACAETCTANTWLAWCLDDTPDPMAYHEAAWDAAEIYPNLIMVESSTRRGLVGTLNHYASQAAAPFVAGGHSPYAIGYLGDDHRPKTVGWDAAYLAALHELGTGIVYGDDEHQGAKLPTQMAMTADIVRTLGYLAPPELWHMYCDNFWKDLGEGAGCLTYLPEVTVTHRHPGAGRGSWDASYRETNAAERYAADQAAYRRYRRARLAHDIAAVAALRAQHDQDVR